MRIAFINFTCYFKTFENLQMKNWRYVFLRSYVMCVCRILVVDSKKYFENVLNCKKGNSSEWDVMCLFSTWMPEVLIILSAVARFLMLLFAFLYSAFVRTRWYAAVLDSAGELFLFFSLSLSLTIRKLYIVIQNSISLARVETELEFTESKALFSYATVRIYSK